MKNWLAYVLVIVGLWYLLIPHEVHMATGLTLGLSNETHKVLGVILLGLAYYEYRRR